MTDANFPDIPDELKEAHEDCSDHRAEIEASEEYGCFYCAAVYPVEDVEETIDPDLVVCGHCGIDAVLPGSVDERYTDEEFLERMAEHWF
jgi:hypothetical protein